MKPEVFCENYNLLCRCPFAIETGTGNREQNVHLDRTTDQAKHVACREKRLQGYYLQILCYRPDFLSVSWCISRQKIEIHGRHWGSMQGGASKSHDNGFKAVLFENVPDPLRDEPHLTRVHRA